MKIKINWKLLVAILISVFIFLIAMVLGCSGTQTQNPGNSSTVDASLQGQASVSANYSAQAEEIKVPSQPLKDKIKSDGFTIDLSNKDMGYITVSSDKAPDKKIKVQISKDGQQYNYDFTDSGPFTTYPLQMGDGIYKIAILQNIENDKYAQVTATDADVQLGNEFDPYLLPNQIVNYSQKSGAVYESFALCSAAQNDLARVAAVYGYIVDNVAYDKQKAADLSSGYLPDVDSTLSSKTGICYDYAALLACMLRVQNIPTRLVMGYVSGVGVYHAWNEVYISGIGWVRAAVYFDGKNWQVADSTFGAADKGATQNAGGNKQYSKLKWY